MSGGGSMNRWVLHEGGGGLNEQVGGIWWGLNEQVGATW